MTLLKERLNRLKTTAVDGTKAESTPIMTEAGWESIGARLEHNAWGHFILRECRYPYEHYHGRYRLGQLVHKAEALSAWSGTMQVHHERMLFFDTETTGLGVGAGNVPFMLGIGYYENGQFVVQQLFMRNPSEELAMLHYLQDKLLHYSHLVSYNGRTFDWPILKNRYVLNRVPFLSEGLQQMDFLYPSRSLWRNSLESCRLSKVEEEKLGMTRHEDVPGSLAPSLYFQYLASGNASVVEGVFRHNESDILTLAGLAIHFSHLLNGQYEVSQMVAEEVFRLGLWFDRIGKRDMAADIWERLLARQDHDDYLIPLAALYKKQKDYDRAVQLWERSIRKGNYGGMPALEPLIELAVYHEHHKKDISQAIRYTEEALNRAWKGLSLSRGNSKQRMVYGELEKRMNRLQNKARTSASEACASMLLF